MSHNFSILGVDVMRLRLENLTDAVEDPYAFDDMSGQSSHVAQPISGICSTRLADERQSGLRSMISHFAFRKSF